VLAGSNGATGPTGGTGVINNGFSIATVANTPGTIYNMAANGYDTDFTNQFYLVNNQSAVAAIMIPHASTAGKMIMFINNVTSANMNLYPQSGDTIILENATACSSACTSTFANYAFEARMISDGSHTWRVIYYAQ
jgi:hypothetical protein